MKNQELTVVLLFIHLVMQTTCQFIYLFLFIYLFIYSFIYLSIHLFIYKYLSKLLHELSESACERLEIVTRQGWGAEAPKSRSSIKSSVNEMFIHHTVTKKCYSIPWCSGELKGIQKMHMNKPGIVSGPL